jgi:hypothetical protein
VEHVARGHCNASVSKKGVARVEGLRMALPQDWEALVQYVEAFEPYEDIDPCPGAMTWGSLRIATDVANMGKLVRVVCRDETLNWFGRKAK